MAVTSRRARPGPRSWTACLLLLGLASTIAATPAPAATPAERRQALLSATAPAPLTAALADPDPVVARTAARRLGDLGTAGRDGLVQALEHPDTVVRYVAALGFAGLGEAALDPLAKALGDAEPMVRKAAVVALSQVTPRTQRAFDMINQATQDPESGVRDVALAAARGAFDPVASIRLPADDWRFRTDVDDVGRDQSWFAVDLDAAGWQPIGIEKAWQEFGHDYMGYAWYRRTIDLPQREGADKVLLEFGGVDERAWVWVNGQYVGGQDIGLSGWDKPFAVDVTEAIRWGATNQITVRVHNEAFAGGIWRPVELKVLELKE